MTIILALSVLALGVVLMVVDYCTAPRNAISESLKTVPFLQPVVAAEASLGGCQTVCPPPKECINGICQWPPAPEPTDKDPTDPPPSTPVPDTPVPPTSVPNTPAPSAKPKDDNGDGDKDDSPPVVVIGTAAVVTRQPTPVISETEFCYQTLEELLSALNFDEDKQIFLWVDKMGLLESPVCPYGKVFSDDVVPDILTLPEFNEYSPLPSSLGTFFDVANPDLARKLELFKTLGFLPDKQTFLLCNTYLPFRHICPRGSTTQKPLDIEKAYTWAWWSKFGPGTIPPPVTAEFLRQYPEMVNYPDSAPFIQAFFEAAKHFDREGPQKVCPRTLPWRNCDIMLIQWYEALYRLYGQ